MQTEFPNDQSPRVFQILEFEDSTCQKGNSIWAKIVETSKETWNLRTPGGKVCNGVKNFLQDNFTCQKFLQKNKPI